MTPEAFVELCQQHYGKSDPDFVKAIEKCLKGELDEEASFQEYVNDLYTRTFGPPRQQGRER